MKRTGVLMVALGLLAASSAAAQAVDPDEPLPPGHPTVGGGSGDDTDDGAEQLPPGHPGGDAAHAEAPRDRVSAAPDLRNGTIEVHVNDENDRPIAGVPVRLGIAKQDVAEGDSHTERAGTSDTRGVAVFDGLPPGTAYTFRATVARDAGVFASEPVRLGETGGERILLHVFPVTRDLRKALIGMRGVVFIQPREDVFHVEQSFQVLNIGMQAWVPDAVHLQLPGGAKAFRSSDAMSDTKIDRSPTGTVEILGTFTPGQHDVGFQFQLDNQHEARRTFHISLPPHVAELRIVAEGGHSLLLSADGFPEAEPMQGQDGSHLLVTGKRLSRGDTALEAIEITLDNLPVPGLGRWYAVGLATLLAGIGLYNGIGRKRSTGERRGPTADPAEVEQAETVVLDELVELEKLRKDERVGPRTYQETRAQLLDALARLELSRAGS